MNILEMVKKLTEEEMKELRIVLLPAKVSGVRDSGKVTRTEKVLETKIAKQMEILINSLPSDKSVTVQEWTDLAIANGLVTQQDPIRITMYYKKGIITGGYAKTVQLNNMGWFERGI